jgi:AraC-like DNA-binding protein
MSEPLPTSVIPLDDRARIAAYPVDGRLDGTIASYWSLQVEVAPARVRVVPDGCIDLVFDLDRAEAHISGVVLSPFEATHDRPTRLLGATLRPGAAPSLLGHALGARRAGVRDLPAGWQPLEAALGPAARALAGQLRDAGDVPRAIALLETFFLARLGRTDARVDAAVRAIASTEGRVGIGGLGRKSGASARNLSRLFGDCVGIPPKRFARIVRAQAALRRLAEVPAPDLAAIAADLGFADHAHMTREVRAVAGASPARLAETFKRRADSFKP